MTLPTGKPALNASGASNAVSDREVKRDSVEGTVCGTAESQLPTGRLTNHPSTLTVAGTLVAWPTVLHRVVALIATSC